jgi:hypothetical protein
MQPVESGDFCSPFDENNVQQ